MPVQDAELSCEVCGERLKFTWRHEPPPTCWAAAMGRGWSDRLFCPNTSEQWHGLIRRKLELLETPFPASILDELWREIAALRQQHCPKFTDTP